MANDAFDRHILNPRERPLSTDLNTAFSQIDRTIRDLMQAQLITRLSGSSDLAATPHSGFFGDGFKVREFSGTTVQVSPGIGLLYNAAADVSVGGIVGLDDRSTYRPVVLLSPLNIAGIPAGPGGGNSRIDIIEVKVPRLVGGPLTRDILNLTTGAFVATVVNKTMSYTAQTAGIVTSPAASTADVSYKVGVAAVTPVEPTVTSGYVKIAAVMVEPSLASVVRGNIIDWRYPHAPYGEIPFGMTVSIPTGAASPPTVPLIRAPPGIEVLCTKSAQPANNRFDIVVLGAGPAFSAFMQAVASQTYSAAQSLIVTPNATTSGLSNSGNRTQWADATLTAPAISVPVGSPYFQTTFQVLRQAAGVTDAAVPDPLLVNIQGTIQTRF
jgi:hypothetical protein